MPASASFSQIATNRVTITDASTDLFTIALAAGEGTGGIVYINTFATDGTDHARACGFATFSAVNKAGTITAVITYDDANDAIAESGGTLTVDMTIADTTNQVTIRIDVASSLTETTHYCDFAVQMLDPNHFPVLV